MAINTGTVNPFCLLPEELREKCVGQLDADSLLVLGRTDTAFRMDFENSVNRTIQLFNKTIPRLIEPVVTKYKDKPELVNTLQSLVVIPMKNSSFGESVSDLSAKIVRIATCLMTHLTDEEIQGVSETQCLALNNSPFCLASAEIGNIFTLAPLFRIANSEAFRLNVSPQTIGELCVKLFHQLPYTRFKHIAHLVEKFHIEVKDYFAFSNRFAEGMPPRDRFKLFNQLIRNLPLDLVENKPLYLQAIAQLFASMIKDGYTMDQATLISNLNLDVQEELRLDVAFQFCKSLNSPRLFQFKLFNQLIRNLHLDLVENKPLYLEAIAQLFASMIKDGYTMDQATLISNLNLDVQEELRLDVAFQFCKSLNSPRLFELFQGISGQLFQGISAQVADELRNQWYPKNLELLIQTSPELEQVYAILQNIQDPEAQEKVRQRVEKRIQQLSWGFLKTNLVEAVNMMSWIPAADREQWYLVHMSSFIPFPLDSAEQWTRFQQFIQENIVVQHGIVSQKFAKMYAEKARYNGLNFVRPSMAFVTDPQIHHHFFSQTVDLVYQESHNFDGIMRIIGAIQDESVRKVAYQTLAMCSELTLDQAVTCSYSGYTDQELPSVFQKLIQSQFQKDSVLIDQLMIYLPRCGSVAEQISVFRTLIQDALVYHGDCALAQRIINEYLMPILGTHRNSSDGDTQMAMMTIPLHLKQLNTTVQNALNRGGQASLKTVWNRYCSVQYQDPVHTGRIWHFPNPFVPLILPEFSQNFDGSRFS